jgi:hypothetical protein
MIEGGGSGARIITPCQTSRVYIVTEVWISPDLKTILSSKRTAPRVGEQTFKLTNLVRTEPDAPPFAPPPRLQAPRRPPARHVSREPLGLLCACNGHANGCPVARCTVLQTTTIEQSSTNVT